MSRLGTGLAGLALHADLGHFFHRVSNSSLDVFMQNVVFGYNFARICGLGTHVDLGNLFRGVWNSQRELFLQNVVFGD